VLAVQAASCAVDEIFGVTHHSRSPPPEGWKADVCPRATGLWAHDLFRRQLPDRAHPVLDMIRTDHLAAFERMQSIDMTLKDLPLWGAPMNSPAGVPVASPRTTTWSLETESSLICHVRSGTDASRARSRR